jgi:general secretion pathway protein A
MAIEEQSNCIAMYNAWWGLKENPFSLSPDPAFFYRSQQHEEAFANLIYGIESRKGFIALTGEVGTGKTTVLECLRDYLRSRDIGYITISNSRLSVSEFFELIAYELRCNSNSKSEVLITLSQLLVQEAEAGRTLVLIIDEAQSLERDVLEEIRLLGNLEDRYGKLLQIVLAGQPELDRKLDAPDLRQLKQRIVLRCSLRPFTEKETLEYVPTRLERAGMPHQTVFPPEVLDDIHRQAQGVPRTINAICDNLLLMTSALGERAATTQMLAKVSEEMRLEGSSDSCQVGPGADPAEKATQAPYRLESTPMPRMASEAMIRTTAASVAVKPLAPLPPRPRRAVRSVWIAAAAVTVLGGLTLLAANDLWRLRQFLPDLLPQPTSSQPTPSQPTWTPPSSTQPSPRQPARSPAPLERRKPRIETPLSTAPARPFPKAKAEPPPTPKAVERTSGPALEPLRIPLLKPTPAVTPGPSIALATTQSEPAPQRRDREVAVESTPAPQVTAPPAPPPTSPSRFAGGWSYPTKGQFYGAEPEFAELAIREDNGHLMGGLSVRFKPGPGALSVPFQFGFGGDLRGASIQTFAIETRNGDKGTIELIPGAAPNMLEVNFHARLIDGRTQSGNMILVKRAASSL